MTPSYHHCHEPVSQHLHVSVLTVGTEYDDLFPVGEARTETHALIVSEAEVGDVEVCAPSGDKLFSRIAGSYPEYLVHHPAAYPHAYHAELAFECEQGAVAECRQFRHTEDVFVVHQGAVVNRFVEDISVFRLQREVRRDARFLCFRKILF